jgi:hypothetical protein
VVEVLEELVGVSFGGAASLAGEDEQALKISPASPADTTTPHASGRRARGRCTSGVVISAGRS